MEIKIDARGLACPKPVIETKKALEQIREGNIITLVDNDIARDNVSKLAKSLKLDFNVSKTEAGYEVSIFKGGFMEVMPEKRPDLSETVIVIGTDVLGEGDRKLGEILMKGYLYALTEYEPYPKAIIMLNSGVNLALKGAATVDHLKKLLEMGTEVLCCGTCLDYYNAKMLLEVGEVTNMYTIVEKMAEANNTIKL